MKWGQITETGLVRPNNEDNLLICPDIGLFVVADGMGGHRAGEVASKQALTYLEKQLRLALSYSNDLAEKLKETITKVNQYIYEMSCQDNSLQGMGTTITACLIKDDLAMVAHVGDSRAYLIRDNTIKQVTDDHSLVGELVKNGSISEELAQVHPRRNVLTQAIGVSPNVDADIYQVPLQARDQLMLCTDGLTNHLTRSDILKTVATTQDPQRAVKQLADAALSQGGTDNITIILIEI
ncbi:Stp1/IreP family PP2C-type Ser/Thr phosphatase [Peptococcaceae bacterium 1198_IL3148]